MVLATASVANAASQWLYVHNATDRTISVIDLDRRILIETIPLSKDAQTDGPGTVNDLRVSDRTGIAYATDQLLGSLIAVRGDGTSSLDEARIFKTKAASGGALALLPDGGSLYAADENGAITFVDAISGKVRREVAHLQRNPFELAINPAGTRLFVSCPPAHQVVALDTTNGAVLGALTVPLGYGRHALALSPDAQQLYVGGSDSLSVINTATMTRSASFAVPGALGSIAFDADRARVYLGLARSDRTGNQIASVCAMDLSTMTCTDGMEVGLFNQNSTPFVEVAVAPDRDELYVAATSDEDESPGSVLILGGAGGALLGTISVGRSPNLFAVGPSRPLERLAPRRCKHACVRERSVCMSSCSDRACVKQCRRAYRTKTVSECRASGTCEAPR
jgi:DNA-binding beta-propeller fold protein YncE